MTVPGPWAFLLLLLGVLRLVRLVTDDSILDRPRDWWVRHAGYWADLAQCPFCCSVWLSAAAWGAYQLWPVVTVSLAVIPAVSIVASYAATLHESVVGRLER